MSIMRRLQRIAKAKINMVLDRAEDPETALSGTIAELEQTVREARGAVAAFAAALRTREERVEQLRQRQAECQEKAKAALQAGDEQSARRALEERLKIEEQMQDVAPSIAESRETFSGLKDNLVVLQDQLNTARLKLAEVQSRKRAAAARRSFGVKMDKVATDSGGRYAAAEAEVRQAESEAGVDDAVRSELRGVESEVKKGARDLRIDAELEALKKSLEQ
jgi:phage shock protein A